MEIISTQAEVAPLHREALSLPMPALLTSTSMPCPGQRLAMMRGTATTSASCSQQLRMSCDKVESGRH